LLCKKNKYGNLVIRVWEYAGFGRFDFDAETQRRGEKVAKAAKVEQLPRQGDNLPEPCTTEVKDSDRKAVSRRNASQSPFAIRSKREASQNVVVDKVRKVM
jgi:hypothetical protein